jgi:hypothetical protein
MKVIHDLLRHLSRIMVLTLKKGKISARSSSGRNTIGDEFFRALDRRGFFLLIGRIFIFEVKKKINPITTQ